MNTLLTHGFFLEDHKDELKIRKPFPLLGILYISAYLNRFNIKHDVFDSTFSNKQELLKLVHKEKPRIIGFFVNLLTKPKVVEILKEIKNDEKLNQVKVVLGGPDVTFNIENYINSGADYLVIGEGEITTKELISAINEGASVADINGIAYKNDQGKIIRTHPRKRIKDLDSLGVPDRNAIDITKYLDFWKEAHGYNCVNISTQRGCPYACNWCNTSVFGHSFVQRSTGSLISELEYLNNTYHPDSIRFVEDLFTFQKEWVIELCQTLKKRNIIIPFECTTRAEYLDVEIIKYLKEAGCYQVWIGAENGSQDMLNAMNTKSSLADITIALGLLKHSEIRTGIFLMLGYPGENMADIHRTISFLKSTLPDEVALSLAYPIKGTVLYNTKKPLLLNTLDWEKTTDRDIDFKRTYPRRFYKYAISRITNEFKYYKYYRKANYFNRTAIKFKFKSVVSMILMYIFSIFRNQ